MVGTVQRIHVVPESDESVRRVERVEAVAGRGLRGDRHFAPEGAGPDRADDDLTLIEAEALRAAEREHDIALEPGAHRRNVTTEGVDLNALVGERFRVGDVVCVGTERCEPCSHLERLAGRRGLCEALARRGGLCARVETDGAIAVGDAVAPLED